MSARMPVDAPLVTIVVAAYRSQSDHLHLAIDSALAQTWSTIEVLVCDDSPDDRLRALVQGFGDRRAVYRHNVPALGVAENHWAAFERARGSFLVVLNHDDWIAPEFVERLLAPLRRDPALVLAFCDHWVIDGAGRRLGTQTDGNSERWGRAALRPGAHRPFVSLVAHQTIPLAMGCLLRRSALPRAWPAVAGPAYDLWLAYLLARRGGGAWFEKERLSAWRSHESNLTSAAGFDWLRGAAGCWSAMAADPAYEPVRDVACRHAANALRACASHALARRRHAEARAWARASLGAAWSGRSAAIWLLTALPERLSATMLRWRAASR